MRVVKAKAHKHAVVDMCVLRVIVCECLVLLTWHVFCTIDCL